jgi:hypothetical protein
LPRVIGLKARIGGRESFVPIDRVQGLEPAAARTSTTKLNLAQFERRPGEVLLRADALDRRLINVDATGRCEAAPPQKPANGRDGTGPSHPPCPGESGGI